MICKKRHIKLLSVIIFILSIGSISWIVYGNDEKDISYSIQEEVVEDGMKAILTIDILSNTKVTEITTITLPDGNVVDEKTSIKYELVENGEYRFIVHYKVLEEDEMQEVVVVDKEEVIVYQEENIQAKIDNKVIEDDNSLKETYRDSVIKDENHNEASILANDIAINSANFPDLNFQNWLLDPKNISGFGEDKILTVTEIANITSIDVSGRNITNLKGIEFFTALTYLNCANNRLSKLDVGKNVELKTIYCHDNQLDTLNLSKNTKLIELYSRSNKLTKLDITENTMLKYLGCELNQLTELDVSKNTELLYLACTANQLTTLDLSHNKKISIYDAGSQTKGVTMSFINDAWKSDLAIRYELGSVTNTNITYNSALGQLYSHSTSITTSNFITTCIDGAGVSRVVSGSLNFTYDGIEINATNFPDNNFRNYLLTDTSSTQINGYGVDKGLTTTELENIKNITVSSKNIKDLKGIEYFKNLEELIFINNQVTEIDISKNTNLTHLYASINQLKKLDVSKNTKLTYLECYNNQLTQLDVSKNGTLVSLYCFQNQIETLNVSNNLKLKELFCRENKISALDVRKNTALVSLGCETNQLTELNLTQNQELVYLACYSNKLTYLDLSKNTKLETYNGVNQIKEIPMTYSNGVWISTSNIKYNLGSINNSNITYNNVTGQFTSSSIKNTTTTFTTNCIDGGGTTRVVSGTLTFTYNMIPVTNIAGVPTTIKAGATVALTGTIVPNNATTTKNISWSVKNAGTTGASITGNNIKTTASGTVVITASIAKATASESTYTKDFIINVIYDTPSSLNCLFSGTTGKNGWYTSNVTVFPPSGYQISKTLGSGYTTSLLYDTSVSPTVYLKQTSTGILYSGKTLSIKIDKIDPDITGIVNGESEISSSNKTVTVSDVNLSSVLLYTADTSAGLSTATAVTQTITNGTSTVALRAANKDQYFKIVAEDLSGRTTIYTYTIMHPTYSITVANLTFDAVEYNYSSVTGKKLNINYQANGANSEASITSIVPSDTNKFTVSGSGKDWTVTPKTGLSAGVHTVTLTANYTGGKTAASTVSMTVNKIKNPFTITQVDILYGETIHPTVSNLKENANLIYYYKLVSANDDAYTSTLPTAPGNYNIKAVSSETANYKTTEYITSFLIQYQLTASNACITIDEAKGITTANDLKTYNQANSNPTGITNQISVSCTNLSSIQSGTPGNYEVKYTLLDITTTVKIQVVEAGYAVSEDRQTGFYGKDSKLTKGEASTITKEELLNQLEVKVITATGVLHEDTSKFMIDMDSIHNASVGNNTIRIGFKEGSIDIEREVTIEILDDNPSAMISLPASIELERVLHNETFEAVKEEKVEILSTVDTEIYSKDFYIRTEPSITITNTEDSKEKFTVQIYDGKENKLTSKETPIAILNGTTKSQKFFVKAYKDLARQRGMYQGTMNFEIGYGEGQ